MVVEVAAARGRRSTVKRHRTAPSQLRSDLESIEWWKTKCRVSVEAESEFDQSLPDSMIFAGLLNRDEDWPERRFGFHEDTEPDPLLNRILTRVAAEQIVCLNVKVNTEAMRRMSKRDADTEALRWWKQFVDEEKRVES